jgi:hypothetical protein
MATEHAKVHPDPSYVVIHVHEGTIIAAYGFDSSLEVDAFREKYEMGDEQEWEDVPKMPHGIHDDPDSDTWVVVEGIRITHVDGEQVEDGRPHVQA